MQKKKTWQLLHKLRFLVLSNKSAYQKTEYTTNTKFKSNTKFTKDVVADDPPSIGLDTPIVCTDCPEEKVVDPFYPRDIPPPELVDVELEVPSR